VTNTGIIFILIVVVAISSIIYGNYFLYRDKIKKTTSALLSKWSKKVRGRDKKCAICNSTKRLQAHHLNNKAEFPEQALDPNNGVTLCYYCHIKKWYAIHRVFGKATRKWHFYIWMPFAKVIVTARVAILPLLIIALVFVIATYYRYFNQIVIFKG
jgi:hypothetical protein